MLGFSVGGDAPAWVAAYVVVISSIIWSFGGLVFVLRAWAVRETYEAEDED